MDRMKIATKYLILLLLCSCSYLERQIIIGKEPSSTKRVPASTSTSMDQDIEFTKQCGDAFGEYINNACFCPNSKEYFNPFHNSCKIK